jgi:hypothetical protein
VVFRDGGTAIAGCASVPVSGGTAQCITSGVAQGLHSITAQYAGNSTYYASTSNTVSQSVQAFRAYLASTGSDANPCNLVAPCRLLPTALAAVVDGGDIWMLDSANYNTATVNITKSVSILAVPGALGSVVAAGGPAINIATANVKVALRNLVIASLPGGGGTSGIVMTNGAALTVDNCLIANLPGSGIDVSTAAKVRVTDTTIRNNAADGLLLGNGASGIIARGTINRNGANGITVQSNTPGITTTADIAYSIIGANFGIGVFAHSTNLSGRVSVSVNSSQIVRNGTSGLLAQSDVAAPVTLSAGNNIISKNGIGLRGSGAQAKVWASGNTVSSNTSGFVSDPGGAVFESAGNNAVRNNGTNNAGNSSGTIATIPMQ